MGQTLSEVGFLRLRQILGDPKAKPAISAIIPISKTQWFSNVKKYPDYWPQPINLGPRTVVYRIEDVLKLISEPMSFKRPDIELIIKETRGAAIQDAIDTTNFFSEDDQDNSLED